MLFTCSLFAFRLSRGKSTSAANSAWRTSFACRLPRPIDALAYHRRPCIYVMRTVCGTRWLPTPARSAMRAERQAQSATKNETDRRGQWRRRRPRRRASRSTRPSSTRRVSFSERLVTLGADDGQTARGKHLLMFLSTTTPRRGGLLLGTTTLRRGRLLLDTTAPQRGGLLVRHGWFVPPRRTSLRFLDNIST